MILKVKIFLGFIYKLFLEKKIILSKLKLFSEKITSLGQLGSNYKILLQQPGDLQQFRNTLQLNITQDMHNAEF